MLVPFELATCVERDGGSMKDENDSSMVGGARAPLERVIWHLCFR